MSDIPATRNATGTELGRSIQAGVQHVPGELGIWLLVLGEMCEFALFFGVLTYARLHDHAMFAQSRLALNQTFGLIDTILLLTGSLFVAAGVSAARQQNRDAAGRLFVWAGVCGLGFAAIKFTEYGHLLATGIYPNTNAFFMYYYVFTGMHLVHLAVSLSVLAYLWFRMRKPVLGPADIRAVESGATFWHLVDLLWVALFPLLYLVF